MHIAIDATPLESGHKGRGVGLYTKYLISALNKYENTHSYTLFTQGQNIPSSADLVHYPYFDPFFLTLPLLKKRPTVVTVHDLIPLVFPDKFPSGIRGWARWQMQKISLLGARRIIADSNTSKNDIARITTFKKTNIDTIYLAPVTQRGARTGKTSLSNLKKKYNIPESYILTVSDVNWNKNISGLLRAFASVLKKYSGLKLVLVGKSFHDTTLAETLKINAEIVDLHIQDAVVKVGYLSDEELAGLYSFARCLVAPSHYEGFGLPVLEAFSCGCPVVASDNSSLAEIAGPAFLVQSEEVQSISRAIENVLGMSEKQRGEIIERGFGWVKEFTWEKVAHETVKTYTLAIT